jgi:uncharacterized protein (DUF488 family)
MRKIATIGYEQTSQDHVLGALENAGIDLLVDVRAVTASRRAGFAKRQLSAGLAEAGIDYLHLRGLGTPAAGREAVRRGQYQEMRRIYERQLETPEAQADLARLAALVEGGTRICLLCYERRPEHCHRRIVTERLGEQMGLEVQDLIP